MKTPSNSEPTEENQGHLRPAVRDPDSEPVPTNAMDRLKQKRAHLRAATTRVINELNTLMDATPIWAGELNDKLGLLKIKEGPLAPLDEEIERLVEDGDLEEGLTTVTRYQESIALTKLRAKRLLSSAA